MTAHRLQRGGFVLGLIVGLLVGLVLALGVALYITKAPIPFINKVPQRTADQDSAEAERNRNWDPNAPLAAKPGPRVAATAAAAASAASAAEAAAAQAAPVPPPAATPTAKPSTRDPAAILSGAATPGAVPAAPAKPAAEAAYIFFVQAGAFTRAEDAEQQRANLALMGLAAKISEREQAGRTVYRVRLGPYPQRDEADALQLKLQEARIEAQIVRVERP
jgi:cell division protein FtsN